MTPCLCGFSMDGEFNFFAFGEREGFVGDEDAVHVIRTNLRNCGGRMPWGELSLNPDS